MGREAVIASIPDFSNLNILVAGDAMLDEYWFGDASRISPEAPVPVIKTHETEQRLGGAANVARNLAELGVSTRFAAIVGADSQASAMQAALEQSGVKAELISDPKLRTIHKLRVLAQNQQLIRLDAEGDLSSRSTQLADQLSKQLESLNAVILSDYAKGTLADVQRMIADCRRANVPVLVDPKGSDFSPYRSATLMTPNQSEFFAVVGDCATEAEFLQRGIQLRSELELEALLVTRGGQGMTLFEADNEPVTLPAQAREVFDVTGAGDTVIANMAAGIAAQLSFADAAALANLAAGVVIAKIGVATANRAELRFALHRRGSGGSGVVALDTLLDIASEVRSRGEKIVMTNGCFDILHAGHVAYLDEAKTLADRLIVAVNDDASVKRLKGSERPIVSLEDRMAVLAGLSAVDWVVPFSDDTPIALIEALLPEVLVKGGDWQAKDIVGSDAVIANGGTVRSLRFKDGRSTTGVIDSIRQRTSDT